MESRERSFIKKIIKIFVILQQLDEAQNKNKESMQL